MCSVLRADLFALRIALFVFLMDNCNFIRVVEEKLSCIIKQSRWSNIDSTTLIPNIYQQTTSNPKLQPYSSREIDPSSLKSTPAKHVDFEVVTRWRRQWVSGKTHTWMLEQEHTHIHWSPLRVYSQFFHLDTCSFLSKWEFPPRALYYNTTVHYIVWCKAIF